MLVLLFWYSDALDRQDRAGPAPLLRAAGGAGPGRLLLRAWRGARRLGGRRCRGTGSVRAGLGRAVRRADRGHGPARAGGGAPGVRRRTAGRGSRPNVLGAEVRERARSHRTG